VMSALADSVTAVENPASGGSDVEAAPASDGQQQSPEEVDAKKLIESFREKRERRAVRAAVCVLAFGIGLSLLGLEFAAISKHMNWENPQLWAVGFGLNNIGLGLSFVVGDKLNFEREFGSITAAKPMWLLVLVPYMYTYITLPKSMFEKYGWLYLYNYLGVHYYLFACFIAGVAQGKLTPFSPAVTDVPLWKRRPTVCEWYTIVASPGILVYAGIDIQLWHYREVSKQQHALCHL
jgi:hypothetical protein